MVTDGAGGGGGGNKALPRISLSFGLNGLLTSTLSEDGTPSTVLRELKLQHFADQPHMRNFIVSSGEMFIDAQKEFKKAGGEGVPQSLITCVSWGYRGIILDLVHSLQESHDDQAAMLYSQLDFVWQFCEVMFISSHPELPVLPYLMDWMSVNFDHSTKILEELANEFPDLDPDSVTKIWSLIFEHTFQGRTTEASRLLKFTNRAEDKVPESQISLMVELMVKMPKFVPGSSSVTDFDAAWVYWREECENRLTQRAFQGNEQLTLLAQVLCGRDEGFAAAKQYMSTWYEYLAMMLNYQFPTIKPSSLKGYVRKSIDEFGDYSIQLSPVEEILLSAMDFDIVSVLKEMQVIWNNPWFALHFSDLIYSSGTYSAALEEGRIDHNSVGLIRNDLVREYGTVLMHHQDLWEVGVKYLEELPEKGGWPVIAELLQRRKANSDSEAEKLIRVAENFDCTLEIRGICREVSLRKLGQGQLQSALMWSIKAGDEPLTTYIVDKLLLEGDIDMVPSLIESMSNYAACGDRLLFLDGYCKFRRFMNQKEFIRAIDVLCKLINYQLIPKRMARQVLSYLHELTEHKVKLLPGQTSIIMKFVQTNVGEEVLGREEFMKINGILIRNRANELLTKFKEAKLRVTSEVL